MRRLVPPGWASALASSTTSASFAALERFLVEERAAHAVFPAEPDTFSALALTPPSAVRVVILGQDPYHDDGQAHGLAFSVRPGVPVPPSLRNIFRELHDDTGTPVPAGGDLRPWALRGVLLLNTVLTVRAHQPASHRQRGWETFTDAVIAHVAAAAAPRVFVLWGAHAQKKRPLLGGTGHPVIASAHPSPLSAHQGFFGSRPFSRVNDALVRAGVSPVDWSLAPSRS